MHRANELERRWLFPLRAAEWRGGLTVDQYIGRSARLFEHPYGQKIETWVWKHNSEISASMDLLPVTFLVKSGHTLTPREGVLIAAVLTPPGKRGKGFGQQLLKTYFSTHPETLAVLYSGVGTDFYGNFGFRAEAHPAQVKEEFVGEQKAPAQLIAVSLSLEEFHTALLANREKTLLSAPSENAAIFYPSYAFLDWHLERYRYFAECVGKTLPDALFWSFNSSSTNTAIELAAVPDYLQQRVDVLWADENSDALGFAHSLGTDWGLPRVRSMVRRAPLDAKSRELPMLRSPVAKTTLVDTQLCDVW